MLSLYHCDHVSQVVVRMRESIPKLRIYSLVSNQKFDISTVSLIAHVGGSCSTQTVSLQHNVQVKRYVWLRS